MAGRKVDAKNVACYAPNGRWLFAGVQDVYEAARLTIANGTTNYDVKATGGKFTTVTTARFLSLRTDQTITVRLNSTSNDAITMTSAGSPYEIELEVTNVFITNASGATANVDFFIN